MSARFRGLSGADPRPQPSRAPGKPRLDAVLDARDRAIESPWFQAFSARFPLTRPVAQKQTSALFDLTAGFVYSQILFACVQLGVFELLRSGAKPVNELSRALRLEREATERLMRAAVALGLVSHRKGDRYALGMLGAALNGNPGVAAMIAHHAALYRDLADPVALLRGEGEATQLSRYWPYASANEPKSAREQDIADYTALMAASQPLVAGDIIGVYPFGKHRCLLDVGGGEGAFLSAIAARWPNLELKLFDLPAVAQRARESLRRKGLSRADVAGGSFLADPLPQGADVISLVRIVHDHDDRAALSLLRAVRAALPPGGTVVIAEPMSGIRGAAKAADAYFGFYLLAMGSGRARTPNEIFALLREAGFRAFRRHRTPRPMIVSLVVGTA